MLSFIVRSSRTYYVYFLRLRSRKIFKVINLDISTNIFNDIKLRDVNYIFSKTNRFIKFNQSTYSYLCSAVDSHWLIYTYSYRNF